MTSAASARSGHRDDHLSIGEVLGQLRPDFPDITISKIRFLEAVGLVEPSRAPSGYRKFAQADVERLRFVLAAQRDHYLPLRVIKDHLDAIDRGEDPQLPGVRRLAPVPTVVVDGSGLPSVETFGRRSTSRLGREELLDVAGISADLLEELEAYGLIQPSGGSMYDGEAVAVAKVAGELAGFGLEPRHLRAVRAAADREVGLIEQLVAPLRAQRGPDAQARAVETSRELAAALTRLHALLVKIGLQTQG
ncbi:MAG TPA: MerR family transcriptional regulator [Actinopolymorphaceae bacterium]